MATALERVTSARTLRDTRRPRLPASPGGILAWLLLVGISILFIVPFFWMLSTSLKDFHDLVGTNWIPQRLAWENYSQAFSFGMWPRWAFNTIVISAAAVIGAVLSTSLVAYAF